MGLLKKIFKPVSKVLDKIIPNEIKPALPYLAAFAPYFGPTSSLLGKGIMQRALLSGGLNIGAQLAQEGNEGDINLLSAGLGALSGAMTAPGAADTFAGSRVVGTGADGKAITASEYAKLSKGANLGSGITSAAEPIAGLADPGMATQTISQIQGPIPFDQVVKGGSSGLTGLAKTKNLALTGLEKGSKFISEGMAGGLKDKAQVLAIPAATATGDLMQAEARQLEKQAAIDAALAEAEALADAGMRGDAIRNAMKAYGFFTDDEIESTVASAGYRAGGRVGFNVGGTTAGQGLSALLGGMEDAEDRSFKFDAQQFMIDKFNEEGVQPEIIGEGVFGDMFIIRTPGGGSMSISTEDFIANFGEPPMKAKGIERDALDQPYRYKVGGRAGFRFGGMDAAIDAVEDEDIKESVKMIADMPDMDLMDLIEEFEITFKRKPMNMEELKQFYRENYEMESPVRMREKIKEKVTVEAKDGGLMDLGGKEMDLRGGGFVPIGKKERADDVPARLSKNEFVMTADAVRAAGGGSVNEGAKRMYKVMNDLEARA